MSFYTDWITSDLSTAYGELSKPIVFRRVVSTGGTSPATNPVVVNGYGMTVAAPASVGATAITLNAPATGYWMLEPGDSLTIGANTVTVASRVVSASGKFTAVPITSALGADITGGQSVAVTWVNDFPCKAIVGSYESSAIDGTLVRVTDIRVMLQPTDTTGRAIPRPQSTDKIIIDGQVKSVVTSNVQYVGESVAVYDVQGRG